MKLRIIKTLVFIALGVALGGFLFSDTQPRTFLQLKGCESVCFSSKELLGLLSSIGIQKFPTVVPSVIYETDKTIVLKHPTPETPIHYLVVPKKDIKNIGEISQADQSYIMDALTVIRKVAIDEKLINYQVITNGPGQQQVTYLHFHLMAFPDEGDAQD